MSSKDDQGVQRPRFVRRSPLAFTSKLCPKCLEPLQKGSRLGGWLVPQDYFCTKCGYHGTVYLERKGNQEEG